MFGRKSEPTLTKQAKRVSEAVAQLPAGQSVHAIATIRHLVQAVRSLGSIDGAVADALMDVVLTLMRKIGMRKLTPGSDETGSDKDFEELKAGLSVELLAVIEAETKS